MCAAAVMYHIETGGIDKCNVLHRDKAQGGPQSKDLGILDVRSETVRVPDSAHSHSSDSFLSRKHLSTLRSGELTSFLRDSEAVLG